MAASIHFNRFESFDSNWPYAKNLDQFTEGEIRDARVAASWLLELSDVMYGNRESLMLHVHKYFDGIVYGVTAILEDGYECNPFGQRQFNPSEFISHVSFALAAFERVREQREAVA